MGQRARVQPFSGLRLLSVLLVSVVVAGCGVPDHMGVRSGLDPRNQDEDVRFRTTYYFRTFDYCFGKNLVDGKKSVLIIPETDSLYRFRMTGKAHSLTTKVRFESETLRASQIDPFDASVVYDPKLGRHRYQSPAEVSETLRRNNLLEDLDRLIALQDRVKENTQAKTNLENAIAAKIAQLGGVTSQGDPAKTKGQLQSMTTTETVAPDGTRTTVTETKNLPDDPSGAATLLSCPDDATVRRGFQILGPEGWRTFDQDERLIMAMTSSASPLIGTLKEYSDRILNGKSKTADVLLPLVRENLSVERTRRVLDGFERTPAPSSDAVFERTLATFGETAK